MQSTLNRVPYSGNLETNRRSSTATRAPHLSGVGCGLQSFSGWPPVLYDWQALTVQNSVVVSCSGLTQPPGPSATPLRNTLVLSWRAGPVLFSSSPGRNPSISSTWQGLRAGTERAV